jgi:arabinogalactan endo-1,4-beta-galactosidase
VNDKPETQLGRRSMLLGAGALALGAGMAPSAFAAAAPEPSLAATFVKAVDVSWAPQMEAKGYTWKNSSGQTQDLLTILKGYGISAVRLRTFVNPSSSATDGHCGINEVAAFAKRIKAAGMSIMLDYMFGDTWNSVGVQNPPAAWKNMNYSQMLTAMNNYVSQTMNVMKTAYNQVKAVSPSSTVCIHLAQPQKYDSMTTFFSRYAGNGGKWDMSVFSSYGSANLASGIVANMKKISDQYRKPFMQTEFGGKVSSVGSTESALVAYGKALKSAGGQGIFYWEPECMSPFTGYAMGAWNSSTKQPTAIMDGFRQL